MLCGEQMGGLVGGQVIRRRVHGSYGDGNGIETADELDGRKSQM